MFSRFAKVALVSTAFAPILLTLAFVRCLRRQFWPQGLGYLLAALLLVALCALLMRTAAAQLEILPFEIKSIKTADKEILAFVLAYLLPIASGGRTVEPAVFGFVFLLLFLVIWTTHSYHFNPLLGLLQYHFYEVTSATDVTFVLVTRRTLRQCGSIGRVVQLTDYIVLDVGEPRGAPK